jgi:hypothetical protein
VRADVIERKELAGDFEQGHQAIVDLDEHFARIGKVGHFGDTYEVWHG